MGAKSLQQRVAHQISACKCNARWRAIVGKRGIGRQESGNGQCRAANNTSGGATSAACGSIKRHDEFPPARPGRGFGRIRFRRKKL